MGLILQQPQLLADRTVFDNVALPLRMVKVTAKAVADKVHTALSAMDLLDKSSLLPTTLSSGEQRRVEIARAIVHQPKVILADEPTANLDQRTAINVMQLFSALNKMGITILVATHDLFLIAAMPYRIFTLKKGALAHG
jgi:cell division transport system ATP-binding protein